MKSKILGVLILSLAVGFFCYAETVGVGIWDYSNDTEYWNYVDGDLVPGTDNTVSIGASGTEVKNVYTEALTLGGVEKIDWGSVISPMTDASGYVNPTDAGNYLRLYDTGYRRLGAATKAGDYYTLYSSDAGSWYAGHDDTSNVYVIGYGTSIGTDVRLKIKFDANDSEITIGDGIAGYDKYLRFEGASTADYYVGIDDTGGDSEDVFVIGTGSVVGTAVAMSIDTSGVVSVTAGLDAIGAADMDYGSADVTDHTFTTDSTGDAEIVLPNDSIGDDEIDWNGLIASHDFEINGTTPSLIVGDGGTEDNMVYFDGVTDFAVGVDHTRSVFEITNGADLDATCAISISTDEDVTLDSGSLYIIDDEKVVFGTDSNWYIEYDETVDDQLLFLTAGTAGTATTDPLFEIIVGATPTADQQVFGVAKGTQASNTPLLTLDEDGDLIIAGTSTLVGNVTLTGDLDIDGNDLTSAGDLLITPGGTEVHIDGGLDIGGTSAVGDNNLIVGGTSTFTGVATFNADPIVAGTTPTLTVGDAGEEDTALVFDGHAQDFHIGLDDTADDLVIGVGSALGTTTAIAIDENTDVTIKGNLVVEGALDLGTVETFGSTDTTPDVSDGSYFLTHASTQTLTDFDGTGIVAGQIIAIESTAAVTYDVDGTPGNLKGGSTNIVTADGDLTTWFYNGVDWLLIAFMDLSDDMS